MITSFLIAIAGVAILLWLLTCLLIVRQKTAAVIEVFGRFHKVKHAGLRLKYPWPIGMVSGRLSTRICELRATIQTKTKDNAFVTLPVAVQYRVKDENVKLAFYELADPTEQLESYILPSVRSRVNAMELEELYTDKDSIETEVMQALADRLDGYGWTIQQVLIDEPQPSEDVVKAFNRVIAATREQEAAHKEGEAHKIREIKDAEAAAESKRLQGKGVAAQRLETAKGMKEAMDMLREAVPNIADESLISMTLITNQFETIRDASGGPNNTILLPYSADSAVDDMRRMAVGMQALGRDALDVRPDVPETPAAPADADPATSDDAA